MSNSAPAILFYFENMKLGAEEQAALALLETLRREGVAFRVLVPSQEGDLAACLAARGFAFDAIEPPRRSGRLGGLLELGAYYRKVCRYFAMYPFQVVHAIGLGACYHSIVLKIRFNVPLIWSFWRMLPGSFALWAFSWLGSVFADHILASSMHVAHQLGRSLRWRERLIVAYRGYEKIPAPSRAQPGGFDAELVVALAGGLAPWLGYRTFLRAIELVRREVPGARAVILEKGDEESFERCRAEIRQLVGELGMMSAVRIVKLEAKGAQGAVCEALREERVTVFVAEKVQPEPFDAGVAEAMGAGFPVVAARCGVLPELLLHEVTGLLVTPGDANALASSILRLKREPKLASEIARNAAQEFETRFGIERYMTMIRKVYANYLPMGAGAAPAAPTMEKDEGRSKAA